MKRFRLEEQPFAGCTGRGVRVAVIDSGIHGTHPHISSVYKTIGDATDRLGHGTAVAAAILEKAPGIELVVIRVFERELTTSAAVLADAMKCAVAEGCQLINLSLGSTNEELQLPQGGLVVAPADWYPGCLPGAIGVQLDWNCPRDELRVQDGVFYASPLPRPIPGIPPEKNFSGISFAVANTTGFLARLLEEGSIDGIRAMLSG